ncbi:MAG: HipA family kinase [Cyclobacteriaceae bacterium]
MPSIKDINYRLPTIEPLQKGQSFLNSANKPFVITGVDTMTGLKDDYVVKLMKAERMSEAAAMREVIAAFIAMELDLPVTLPALINMPPDFINILKGESEYLVASQSLGYNFGTRYVTGYQVFAVNQALPNTLIDSALEIFAFDVLIQNADRSHEAPKKPNLNTNGKQLLIFDHEVAFGFIFELPFSKNKQPWVIRDIDKLWIEKHCLFRSLRGNLFDEQNLLHKFARLDNAFWNRCWVLLPDSWREKEQFESIKGFVNQIVSNGSIFIKNLQLLLA